MQCIKIPYSTLYCEDWHCKEHSSVLQKFHDDIVDSCVRSAEKTIPKISAKIKAHSIPGWNDHVRPLHETALFWHRIWKESGFPHVGYVADICRQTRARYHHAVHQVKHRSDNLRAEKLANSLVNKNIKCFWKVVRQMKTNNKKSIPTCIDNITGEKEISDLFHEKYRSLYNSVPYDSKEMQKLMHDVDKHIQLRCLNYNCYNSHAVTVYDVQQSLKHLKKRKKDGLTDCESDNFINATPKLSIYLSMLFSSMIKHRFAPSDMLISTIVPIPKNKHKSMNYSDNYRAIALSSVLGKLLESVILYQNKSVFSTSDYQFGFKINHSTTSCSFVAQEVINYYKTNHSDAFVMFLDASKAFDKVHYCKLFKYC